MKERPIEPNCFETEREEQWHDVGYYDGYQKAVEQILSQLQEKYDMANKQDGRKVTCMISKYHTPQERYERHQGYLSGLLVAIGITKKEKEE